VLTAAATAAGAAAAGAMAAAVAMGASAVAAVAGVAVTVAVAALATAEGVAVIVGAAAATAGARLMVSGFVHPALRVDRSCQELPSAQLIAAPVHLPSRLLGPPLGLKSTWILLLSTTVAAAVHGVPFSSAPLTTVPVPLVEMERSQPGWPGSA